MALVNIAPITLTQTAPKSIENARLTVVLPENTISFQVFVLSAHIMSFLLELKMPRSKQNARQPAATVKLRLTAITVCVGLANNILIQKTMGLNVSQMNAIMRHMFSSLTEDVASVMCSNILTSLVSFALQILAITQPKYY